MTSRDTQALANQAEPGVPAKTSTRDRIIEVASALFYAQGLRAVSADKIIADAGISKVTFYRHFPTKDELIVAYLEGRAQWERDAIAAARHAAADVPAVFQIVAEAIGAESCSPGFRGCPFINAAAEYADPEHPIRKTVDAHRHWFKQTIRELLDEIEVPDSSRVADELVMLRDGAMVAGYLSDPRIVATALSNAGRAVIEFARSTATRGDR
jgi:AcrR family transcriptional regulator